MNAKEHEHVDQLLDSLRTEWHKAIDRGDRIYLDEVAHSQQVPTGSGMYWQHKPTGERTLTITIESKPVCRETEAEQQYKAFFAGLAASEHSTIAPEQKSPEQNPAGGNRREFL